MSSLRHVAPLAVTLALALAPACTSSRSEPESCDYVTTRCNTVCDYWCDDFGCYPDCYDRCWQDCGTYGPGGNPGVLPPDEAGAADAGDAAPIDASPPPSEGGASDAGLCASCASNDACAAGALCVFRGGSSQSGFCATACSAPSDCPQGFSCTAFGGAKHCLPTSDSSCM
jgi:hypothetical protein